MSIFKPVANTNLYVEVINSIITAIATGELKAGEKIIEQNIATEMQISRAPIREAIRELAAQGILEYAPKRGATVAELTVKNIEEVYSLRATLESMAIGLAMKNFSKDDIEQMKKLSKEMTNDLKKQDIEKFIEKDVIFHNLICERSNHSKLQKLLENFILQTKLYMIMSKYKMLINLELSLEYGVHEGIIKSIEEKNSKLAEEEMKKHIINSGNVLINYILKNDSLKKENEL
jgi:DNA-binding GntR family transcriptional regulator